MWLEISTTSSLIFSQQFLLLNPFPVFLLWIFLGFLSPQKKKKKESDFPEPESQVGVFAIATASSHEVSSILSVKATSGSLLSSEPTTLPFCAVMRGSNLCAAAGAKKGRLLLAIAPPVELCIEVVVTFRVFFCGWHSTM